MNRIFIILIVFILYSCASYKPYYQNERNSGEQPPTDQLTYSIFLLGGAEEPKEQIPSVTKLLSSQLEQAGGQGTLIFLGNYSSKKGMPDSSQVARRREVEGLLANKLQLLKKFKGNMLMVPGNYEWANGGKDGYQRVINMEEYVEQEVDKGNIFLPDDACPGPVEISLGKDLVAVLLNTQWFLHEWDKPGEESGCEITEGVDILIQLEDIIRRNAHKKVIVAGHHPIFSNGPHGGYLPAYVHFLPPLAGSLYAGYRKNIGNLQDLASAKYKILRKGLLRIFSRYPNLIYASGHEQSLQYHPIGDQHYIVSGAAGKATPVKTGNKAQFAYGHQGFGKINVYSNGEVWLEFWVPEGGKGKLVFQQKMMEHPYVGPPEDPYTSISYQGQTKDAAANTALAHDREKPGLLGLNYRKEWSAKLKDVPVFDIGKEKGGLKIVKKGGGMQTKSLRLEDKEGRQYTLRSVEKFPEKAIPSMLRGTVASDLVYDQISASHPYGALVVPTLSKAAGVYHTNPQLVYLPDDPRLGKYREDFSDGLYLFEERPDDEWGGQNSFGNADKIVSTFTVIKKIRKDDKHYVDEKQVLRSRLFDIWVGDWDRHDDQWRWAAFKDEKGHTYYQPIPRDRDQIFFRGDGAFIKLFSHKWGMPKIQGFHHKIRDVEGLEFNARHFDRTFLTELSLEDWMEMAKELQERLDDEIIEEAIKEFPPEIYAESGEVIIAKLKSRRKDLPKYARKYYLFLAENVDVVGSNKRELFEVKRLNNEALEVKFYRVNKKGEIKHQVYERTFKASETKEVRLYGLKGDDIFKIEGEVGKSIKVRVIGGEGKDNIIDNSKVKGGGKKTIVYDTKEGNQLDLGSEARNKTSDRPEINEYNRYAFKYNQLLPLVFFQVNPDDGFFFGGGFIWTRHGFRKDPFAVKHQVVGSLAPRTGSFTLEYKGHFTDVLGKWDYLLDVSISEPSFSDFFYGFGNKTISDEEARDNDKQHYLTRYSQYFLKPSLRLDFGEEKHHIQLGGYFRSVEISANDNDKEPDRFILTYPELTGRGEESVSQLLNNRRNYIGGAIGYEFDTRDNLNITTRGFRWGLQGKVVKQFGDEKLDYQQIESNASFYISTGGSLNTTLAVRAGGSLAFGDFEFYQASRLGGTTNLRGYRKFRFAGDQGFYQNTEIRIKLLEFKTQLFPGSLGVLAFHDIGRVWSDDPDRIFFDESLEDWHRGFGGGLWISPLGQVVISTEVSLSNDEDNTLLFIRFGFLY